MKTHPVQFLVAQPIERRSRLTALFRPVLAIPHVLIVGGPLVLLSGEAYAFGVLGAVAGLFACFDWLGIVVTGRPVAGLDAWKRLYLRWRARTLAYCAFLRDEYPPFNDGPYPAEVELPLPPASRDRLNVLLRPIFVLPHLLVLVLLTALWLVVLLLSWIVVVVTGDLRPSLFRLNRDIAAYSLRTEAYLLLIHDEFPPFALAAEPASVADDSGSLSSPI